MGKAKEPVAIFSYEKKDKELSDKKQTMEIVIKFIKLGLAKI